MSNKLLYEKFCKEVYIPIYSKPWWMDAVCGQDNWDVWLYTKGNNILAAMPYYKEKRGRYQYITKALLTQNNGIIFNYPNDGNLKQNTKQAFEEEVIEYACRFIDSLNLDVYEQQYHYEFTYWLPFFWNKYTAMTRVTYVIENTSDIECVWNGISPKYRKNIRKGQHNSTFKTGLDEDIFFKEHEKIFKKQGLECPFTIAFWHRLAKACSEHDACRIMYAETPAGEIASILFLIWDEKSIYHLLGGSIPEFQNLETYNALTWEAIKYAGTRNLKYDFEGSVIKRISKSFREFGGEPKRYYRIRKVFNEEILLQEYEKQLINLQEEKRQKQWNSEI